MVGECRIAAMSYPRWDNSFDVIYQGCQIISRIVSLTRSRLCLPLLVSNSRKFTYAFLLRLNRESNSNHTNTLRSPSCPTPGSRFSSPHWHNQHHHNHLELYPHPRISNLLHQPSTGTLWENSIPYIPGAYWFSRPGESSPPQATPSLSAYTAYPLMTYWESTVWLHQFHPGF